MSVARTAPQQPPRATYQDVLDAPAHLVAEIIDGTLYTHPRPAPRHATASTRLTIEIGGPFDRGRGGPGGWRILDEPELHLGGRSPGTGPGRMASRANARAPRHRVLHARS